MQKLYVFWGIFVLVMVGVVATLIRDARRRRRREAEEARSRPAAVAVPPVPPAPRPAQPHHDIFDPAATRVHVHSASAGAQANAANRDVAQLPSDANPRLACVGGPLKDRRFAITSVGITVGRNAGNDIVLTDPRVSNHHAWVGIVERKVVLRDLGSTNGTFLNARIEVPVSEVVLKPGDTIFFGGNGRDQFVLELD